MRDELTREQVEAAIQETEYKYFGDYEFSSAQRDAVHILVSASTQFLTLRTRLEEPTAMAEKAEQAERERDTAYEEAARICEWAGNDSDSISRERLIEVACKLRMKPEMSPALKDKCSLLEQQVADLTAKLAAAEQDAKNRRDELERVILESCHTHEVLIPDLEHQLTTAKDEAEKLGRMLNDRDLKCDEQRCGAQAELRETLAEAKRLREALKLAKYRLQDLLPFGRTEATKDIINLAQQALMPPVTP